MQQPVCQLLFPGFILFMLVTLYLFKEVIWPFAGLAGGAVGAADHLVGAEGRQASWAVLSVFLVLLVVLGVGLLWLVPPFLRDLNRAAFSPEYAGSARLSEQAGCSTTASKHNLMLKVS